MEITRDNTNVVIIGGGPVGLATAIQTKIRNSGAHIVIYEKYPEYKRHHVLQLEQRSFSEFPTDEKIQEVIGQFFDKEKSFFSSISSWILPEKVNLPTSEIEEKFKQLAINLGIEFRYEQVDRPKSLMTAHPNAKIFVGADGSHSEVRKQIFTKDKSIALKEIKALLSFVKEQDPSMTFEQLKELIKDAGIRIEKAPADQKDRLRPFFESLNERYPETQQFLPIAIQKMAREKLQNQQDLQYIAELKYEVKGKAQPVNYVFDGYPAQKLLNSVIFEYVGKPKYIKKSNTFVTKITIRVITGEKVFNQLKDKATFKTPMRLDDPDLPKSLKKTFSAWLNLREQEYINKSIFGKNSRWWTTVENPNDRQNEQITVTKLQKYRSEEVVSEVDGRIWCLVGDAAGGVPFFRSLNGLGLPGSSKLAKVIAKVIDSIELDSNENSAIDGKPFMQYAAFAKEISDWELSVATSKSYSIESYKAWVYLSRLVPWQINKFTKEYADQILQENDSSEKEN